MTSNRIVARTVLTAGLAVGATLAMALPATAHGTRQVTCDGTIGATTVASVVVADGTTCVLEGTKVKGGVTVGAGAALDMSDVTVYQSVTATRSGRVTATGSQVYGAVKATGAGVVRLTDTAVVGSVAVTGEATSFSASQVAVGGNLSGTTVSRFDVSDSYVLGTIAATEAFNGGNLCGNWVYRDTRFEGSAGAILLGGSDSCAGNEVRGDVAVNNNVAYIAIDGNVVKGDLSCAGNDPAPELGTNTVRGTRTDQCA